MLFALSLFILTVRLNQQSRELRFFELNSVESKEFVVFSVISIFKITKINILQILQILWNSIWKNSVESDEL